MNKYYCPCEVEKIAQNYWNDNQTFVVTEQNNKEKYYCLSMLPYPSGNLHMGHVRNYTIGDVIARYQRMLGKNVLHPIGWDAFGLPAEQAAITNNTDPKNWTYSNINDMKNQLQKLGYAYDWSREIITCDPKYYHWEQWFFTILYKKGLAYKKTTLVNWCPYHETVLANEQVINNRCWRCFNIVQYKKVSQWFLKITNYADQLLYGLDQLKYWPEQVKNMQRNWIGRSEGMHVIFKIVNSNDIITVYLTNLDTFMGITYLAISVDHPIALKSAIVNIKLADFIKKNNDCFVKLNKDRILFDTKEGMPTNFYAIHPITNSILPIWVTNFVTRIELEGMGAMVGIPAHNQQDWEFAHYYNLPIKSVIKKLDKIKTIVSIENCDDQKENVLFNAGYFNGLTSNIASKIITKLLIKRRLANYSIKYNLKDWGVSRQRYWGVPIPMMQLNNGEIKAVSVDQLPVLLPDKTFFNDKIRDIYSNTAYFRWLYNFYKGRLAKRDTDTFDTFMESSWYYARYTCPYYEKGILNSHAANYWLPVDQYIGGIEHATMHLIYFRFYHKLMRDAGLIKSDEPAIRLLCQGMVLYDSFYYLSSTGEQIWIAPHNAIIQRDSKTNKIISAVDHHGNKLVYAGMCKMSKSKNNGVNPNTIIKKYGADAVRFFVMFAAPPESTLEWKESGIEGAYRFLKKIWNLVYTHVQINSKYNLQITKLNNNQKFIRYCTHKTIMKVTDDIDRRQSFNTALSEIMKLTNKLYYASKLTFQDHAVVQEALLVIIRLLYPFTPHISFILWKNLKQSKNIDDVEWPIADIQAIQEIQNKNSLIIVQINGKIKYKIYVPLNSSKNAILKILEKKMILNKLINIKNIDKIIYIPNKVINFLIQNDSNKNSVI